MAKTNIWTGMAAGMIGGLAGAFVMGLAHRYLSQAAGTPAGGGPQDATALAADAVFQAVTGRELTLPEKDIGGQILHYAFGTAAGGLYGAAAAAVPQAAAGLGVPFGAAVYAGAHSYAVPRLGLADSPLEQPLPAEGVELAAHLVYGVVTDLVRRAVLRLA